MAQEIAVRNKLPLYHNRHRKGIIGIRDVHITSVFFYDSLHASKPDSMGFFFCFVGEEPPAFLLDLVDFRVFNFIAEETICISGFQRQCPLG